MTAAEHAGRSTAKSAWVLFALTGAAMGLSLWVFGFARGADAAKTTLWWFTLGGSLLALSRSHFARWTAWIWLGLALCFGIDGATQGVIRGFFGVAPQANVIAEALANTNAAESFGFVMEQRLPILKGLVFALALAASGWWGRRLWPKHNHHSKPLAKWAWRLSIGLTLLLHLNSTMRAQHPLMRWFVVFHRHTQAQAEIAGFESERQKLWAQHAQWQVQRLDDRPRTVVMFIGESDNRLNWQLLGYPRNTTEPLQAAFARLPGDITLYAQARSTQAFTLPSLKLALTPATQAQSQLWNQTPDITMLAKAAGYHVTWLSNQPSNDGWFSAIARQADESIFINHGNWRDSSAVDRDLNTPLSQVLAKASPKHELIVVHLLGQHFHYTQRCPSGTAPFSQLDNDAVMQAMKAAGRSDNTRQSRNAYDNAVYCGAQAVATMLDTLYKSRNQRAISAFYFSDHGQEVGHTRDFAGHSEADESGHTIPAWTWTYQPGRAITPLQINAEPYVLDVADLTMHQLLRIRTPWGPN